MTYEIRSTVCDVDREYTVHDVPKTHVYREVHFLT